MLSLQITLVLGAESAALVFYSAHLLGVARLGEHDSVVLAARQTGFARILAQRMHEAIDPRFRLHHRLKLTATIVGFDGWQPDCAALLLAG